MTTLGIVIRAIVVFGSVLGFGIWLMRVQYRKADARLEEWAQRSRYRVLEKESANPYNTGPKPAHASNRQVMYRVTVEDAQGVKRRALVKIGSVTIGTLADDFSVEWEDGGK
ncbi:MAG: hypothetical protein JWN04_4689 [Myxococcaceae bacterium]|nr:hypothetical protein [Myxococcaceae bacterium]